MGNNGAQQYWKTGARFFFQPDPELESPYFDLGTIGVVSPALTVEESTLEDSDGGRKLVVDTDASKFEEKYDITLYNLAIKNLQFLFLAGSPETFSQAAATSSAAHVGRLGELIKIRSAYSSSADYLYNLGQLRTVGVAPYFAITAISSTQFTLTLPTGRAANTIFTVGDKVRVFGNATSEANTEFTITAVSGTGASSLITVASTLGATASGYLAVCTAALSNIFTHPITGGSASTITIAGDWTLHYAAGTRLHYWDGTTTSAVNNSTPAQYDSTPDDTGLNSYLVASVAHVAGTTTITIDASTPLAASPTATGTIIRCLRYDVDYIDGDLMRGFIRTLSTATGFVDKQVLVPLWVTNAITASKRLLHPQTKKGPFIGRGVVEWSQGGFANRVVREFRCSIVPGAGAFSDTEYSNFPLSVTVLTDSTNTTAPAGRVLHYEGDVPRSS